ncbi:MAG: FAD-binding protein [Candidatus Lokiarchaeota archaeon]|nr:FAD-binding protein [Candidatus Lokiarchaeota archaeon]
MKLERNSRINQTNKSEIKSKLEEIFGAKNVTDKKHNLLPYSYDATECEPGMPDFICMVENVGQVINVVKYANNKKIPLVPYITGNNIGGLTIPQEGGVVLDFGKKMNQIIHIHESHMYALLEPGVTFGQLYKHLKENYPHLRYCYPFAPPYSGVVGNAILSGMNNLSCIHGSMGDWINGLEVVLYDGSIVRIGSCFMGDKLSVDNWHSRYPMPDLMGLFVNWQGATGIVTKCAVQLWPRKKIERKLLAICKNSAVTAEFIREIGRLEIVDDISAVSVEVAKMALGDPTPVKLDSEPDFPVILPMSAHNEQHYQVKVDLVNQCIKKIEKKYNTTIQCTDFDYFAACIGDDIRVFADLPNVITPLVEYSGLTWVGTYAPPDNLEPLIDETAQVFIKFDIPMFIYMKSMKSSHYAIFRPIIRYKKELEEERMKKATADILEVCLKYGCIPYKTPVWMAKRLQEIIDPNWLKFFKRTKKFMDPNNIFNPGRWGI